MTDATPAEEKNSEEKIPAWVHVACGWPLILVFIGGALGGGLGGGAYGINMGIYKSSMPAGAKILLNILTGAAAAGIWYGVAMAIRSQM